MLMHWHRVGMETQLAHEQQIGVPACRCSQQCQQSPHAPAPTAAASVQLLHWLLGSQLWDRSIRMIHLQEGNPSWVTDLQECMPRRHYVPIMYPLCMINRVVGTTRLITLSMQQTLQVLREMEAAFRCQSGSSPMPDGHAPALQSASTSIFCHE